jgi:hypothetical protein
MHRFTEISNGMALARFVLLLFNVAVVSFLIYRMFEVGKQSMEKSKKVIVIVSGILLLLAPFGMFFGFFSATPQYFLIYPIAIALFLYMIREIK